MAFSGRPSTGPDANLEIGDLRVSAATRTVTLCGREVALRPREFDLLHALARRHGDVVSRGELLREVWGYSSEVETRTIDTHVVELRRKLDEAAHGVPFIVTVRKSGYRLASVSSATGATASTMSESDEPAGEKCHDHVT